MVRSETRRGVQITEFVRVMKFVIRWFKPTSTTGYWLAIRGKGSLVGVTVPQSLARCDMAWLGLFSHLWLQTNMSAQRPLLSSPLLSYRKPTLWTLHWFHLTINWLTTESALWDCFIPTLHIICLWRETKPRHHHSPPSPPLELSHLWLGLANI